MRHATLHAFSIALARQPEVVAFARRLVCACDERDRLARLAAVFTFVRRLAERTPVQAAEAGNAVAALLMLVGQDRGPAVVLAALLLALGERVRLECTREMAFARVALAREDVLRLPPHARTIRGPGRTDLPLDPRRGRSPFGFLPQPVRELLHQRSEVTSFRRAS